MKVTNKNTIIIGLLAVVALMVIAYAAFSTTLSISSSANVTSTWNVAFDTNSHTASPTTGAGGTTAPTGTVNYSNGNRTATVVASLHQPGDKIIFTLTIKNTGSLNATLGSTTLSNASGCSINSLVCTSSNGNIKITATNPAQSSLVASTGETTITVTAEFVNKGAGNTYNASETASVNVNVTATQA